MTFGAENLTDHKTIDHFTNNRIYFDIDLFNKDNKAHHRERNTGLYVFYHLMQTRLVASLFFISCLGIKSSISLSATSHISKTGNFIQGNRLSSFTIGVDNRRQQMTAHIVLRSKNIHTKTSSFLNYTASLFRYIFKLIVINCNLR